jgi:chromate reductase
MKTPRILTLVGGISLESINKKLFNAFKDVVGDEAELVLADISKLPFFSQDLENDPPDQVTSFKDQIRHADAVLFITPEYNRSIPAVLKNAIDWATRPYPQNLWEKIPVATMGVSAGNTGTYGAQNHLRAILNYLNMYILNQPEFYMNGSKAFNQEGKLIDEKSRKHIEQLWSSFKDWIEKHQEPKSGAIRHRMKAQGLEDSPWVQH